jgi:hypothetical protein
MEETKTPPIQPELTPEQKKDMEAKVEMLTFLGLTYADGNTRYINIQYPAARTCIILGALGLHCRMTGEQKGKFWDEKLGIHLDQEKNHDTTMSCKRSHVFQVLTIRKKIDWDTAPDLSQEEKAKQPEFLWDMVIKYEEGDITINGLPEANAIAYKNMIWTWMNFNNSTVQNNQG